VKRHTTPADPLCTVTDAVTFTITPYGMYRFHRDGWMAYTLAAVVMRSQLSLCVVLPTSTPVPGVMDHISCAA
jgi:hypothetical protein